MRTLSPEATRAFLITCVIAGGLAADQHVPFWGQAVTNVIVWLLLIRWLFKAEHEQRIMLTACVVYATLGECFLSLVWGLYDYRLGNIPLFVPPGHALLFLLGTLLATRLRDWITWLVPLAATPFVLLLAIAGLDTFGVLLFAMLVICMIFSRARKLYAVMFVLSLAMEIYGTWMGNWTWSTSAPWLGLATVNPPLAAGAFYCVLDLLVVATVSRYAWRRQTIVAPAANAA